MRLLIAMNELLGNDETKQRLLSLTIAHVRSQVLPASTTVDSSPNPARVTAVSEQYKSPFAMSAQLQWMTCRCYNGFWDPKK